VSIAQVLLIISQMEYTQTPTVMIDHNNSNGRTYVYYIMFRELPRLHTGPLLFNLLWMDLYVLVYQLLQLFYVS
jgi:hypothetical protein